MALCSQQEKCCIDIIQKLKIWKLSDKDIDKIIAYLVKEDFINEERYAKAFVNDKFKFNKWGKQKIKFALLQKKLSENVIEKALNMIDIEEYKLLIEKEVRKKMASLINDEPVKMKEKLIRFAISKGFEPDLIYPVVNSILAT